MEYECKNCDWSGTWDEMIHETLCPSCRSATQPVDTEAHPRVAPVVRLCPPDAPGE
ncbi:MAG: hypothetical protein AB7E51_17730 [Pseudodesulfovibrio sp.]|jgi:Zn finger protein HypA/HybF involved in hydrogenase expression|uniref:Uncharacterized protein n=1 Tax=Pseudodesulfovibrio indicus TaxID=1716143 RepID=A0AA94TIV1_9BACT|nr:hypothetical protein EDC59_107105 [Pseudodesulfovibrio indicus]